MAKEIRNLKEELEMSRATARAVEETVEFNKELEQSRAEAELQADRATTHIKYQELCAETERLKAADVAATLLLSEKEEDVHRLVEELGESRNEVARLASEMNQLLEDRDESRKEADQLLAVDAMRNAEALRLQEELTQIIAIASQNEQERDAYHIELEELKLKVPHLVQDLQHSRDEVSQLEEARDVVLAAHAVELQEKAEIISKQGEEILRCENAMDHWKTEAEKLATDLAKQQQELEQCRLELEKSKEQRTAAAVARKMETEDELEVLKRKYQKNMTLVSRQSWELEELQEELQTWKSEAQKSSKIIAEHLEAQKEMEVLKRKFQKNMALVSRQSRELEECQEEVQKRRNESQKSSSVIAEHLKELEQAKEELENIKQQKERDAAIALKQSEVLTRCRNDLDQWQQEAREQKEELAKQAQELEECRAEAKQSEQLFSAEALVEKSKMVQDESLHLAEKTQMAEEVEALRASEAMHLAEITQTAKERHECYLRTEQLCAAEEAQMARLASLTEDLRKCQEEKDALRKVIETPAPELQELREQRHQVAEELRKAEDLWSKVHAEQNVSEVGRPRRLSTVSLPLAQACRSQSASRRCDVQVQTSLHQSPQTDSRLDIRTRAVSVPPDAQTTTSLTTDTKLVQNLVPDFEKPTMPGSAHPLCLPGMQPLEGQFPLASESIKPEQDAVWPLHPVSVAPLGTGVSSQQSLRLCAELDANSLSASWLAGSGIPQVLPVSPPSAARSRRKIRSRSSSCGSRSPGSVSTARTAALNPVIFRSRSHSPVRRFATGPTLSLPSRQVIATRSMPMPHTTGASTRPTPWIPRPITKSVCPAVLPQPVIETSMGLPRTRRCIVPGGACEPHNFTFASCRSWSPVRVEPDLVCGRAWLPKSPTSTLQKSKDPESFLQVNTISQTATSSQVVDALKPTIPSQRPLRERSPRCCCEEFCGPL